MVGADLANLVNEAALLAARRDHEKVAARRLHRRAREDRAGRRAQDPDRARTTDARTAYHEAGHAIVGMVTPGADPVRKVSIIPRGMALGVTFSAPERRPLQLRPRLPARQDQGRARRPGGRGDRLRRPHHRGRVRHPAGHLDRPPDGRALGDEHGHRPDRGDPSRGPERALLPGAAETSAKTQEGVDEEVRRIIFDAYEEVHRLLVEHRDKLESLTQALLQHETLDEADAYQAAGLPRPPMDEDADPTRGEIVAPAQASITPSAE